MSELDTILADIKAGEAISAARRDWNPHCRGEIDIRIAADGSWFHQQRRFQRDSMVKLFASILRREDEEYFLVTPAEKLRIEVEDAPFIATLVEVSRLTANRPSYLLLTLASASSPIMSTRSGLKSTPTAIHPDLIYMLAMVSTH